MYTEFLAAALEAQGQIEEERIAEAFERLDDDSSGYILKKNLKSFLGDDIPPEKVDDVLNQVDVDRDGKSKFSLFITTMVIRIMVKKVDISSLALFFFLSIFQKVSYDDFLTMFRTASIIEQESSVLDKRFFVENHANTEQQ